MSKIMNLIQYSIQHYNPKKYWKYRKIVQEESNNILFRYYCLFYIKRCDAFNNASTGANIDKCAKFGSAPKLPHGLNGIIISPYAIIGENCIIRQQVTIAEKNGKAPIIGNNVVIGAGAKILGDIKIGNNVIIGANAVVTKSFEDNVVIAGVPAKIIK